MSTEAMASEDDIPSEASGIDPFRPSVHPPFRALRQPHGCWYPAASNAG
jgi:hypothetical protein